MEWGVLVGSGWGRLGSGYRIFNNGTNLYIGGNFTAAGGLLANRIVSWDGTDYPGASSQVCYALAASGSDLFVGGIFRMAGSKGSFEIARWNPALNFDRPQLSNPAWRNGQFHARLSGTYGLSYVVQATTNFTTWTPVLTNSTGIYDFTDPGSSGAPRRSYRALLSPF